MSQYRITHSCGHVETHYFTGEKHADQDRKAEWLETKPCTECMRAAAIESKEKFDTEFANLPALTTLTGGEARHVEVASTIRETKLKEAFRFAESDKDMQIRCRDEGGITADAAAYRISLYAAAIDLLRSKTEARYWIENGKFRGDQMLIACLQQIRKENTG